MRNAEQKDWGTQKQSSRAGFGTENYIIGRRGNYGVWARRFIRVRSAQIVFLQFQTTKHVRAHSSRLRLRSVSSATLTFSTLTSVALPSLSLFATAFCNAN